ncbi:hypothetical protein FRC08_003720 [Ceratobasidium sp. 394]|nr:hypothetical protein FRC08_003720 [Ceratobasidium sp. 394]
MQTPFSPNDSTSNIYSQAFDHWKAVHELLITNPDAYLAECTQLDSILQQPGAREWSGLEDSLVTVDSVVALLNLLPAMWPHTRAILGAVRNRSRKLVPLNRLPAELVVRILSLADTDCLASCQYNSFDEKQYRLPPVICVSVASKWLRDIVTSAPSLWTHLDLAMGEPYEEMYMHRARTYLRYSEQLLLYVHVAEDEAIKQRQAADIIGFLTPFMHRVVSLELHVAAHFIREIMLGLFNNLTSCQVRELCLSARDAFTKLVDSSFYNELFDGRFDRFLQPLRALNIRGAAPPLDSVAFRGLTVLKLYGCEFSKPTPTFSQIISVLAACPELRALTLVACKYQVAPGMLGRVSLPRLELLDLRQVAADTVMSFLACIVPGPSLPTFGVTLEQGMSEARLTSLRRFIKRLNVRRLCLKRHLFSPSLTWPPVLTDCEFPAVEELALCSFEFRQLGVEHSLAASRFPSLRRLHLLGCHPTPDDCRHLLDSSAIRAVYVDHFRYGVAESSIVPPMQCRDYLSFCRGEGHFEWPLYG